MTTKEFKKLKPEYKDLEGDQLWDAMTYYMLRQQQASEIIKAIKPLWKTHTFRYLFYRRKQNICFGKNDYSSDKICSKCKKGTGGLKLMMLNFRPNGKSITYCPHGCGELFQIPNTNLNHKLWIIGNRISKLFWFILDKLHIIRSSINSRYDMGGDESRYILRWSMNMDTGEFKPIHRKRKWWEYIIIEKPIHNF